jgi:hypothetical protein
VTAVATGLATNRAALDGNASSLAELATETRALSERLDAVALTASIDDLRVLLVVVLGIAALGAAVPAIGALLVGMWLRRELGVRRAGDPAAGPLEA